MANLYANENFPVPVVERLRVLGHDVVTVRESGKADQAMTDIAVLEFATAEQRRVDLEPPPFHSVTSAATGACGHYRLHVRS